MAGDDLRPAAVPEPVFLDAGPVEEYLAVVEKGLIGPRRWRSGVLAELRDGLVEAAQAHAASTGSSGEAAAVAEFGSPRAVLGGFLANGAATLSRRVALGVLASGPAAAAAWVVAMASSGIAPWQHGLTGPWRILPGVGAVLVVAVPGALLVLAATGRTGHRWGAARPRLAPAAAGLATSACAMADVVMLAAVVVWLMSTVAPPAWPVIAVAGVISAVRGLLAGWASRRCLVALARLA